MSPVLIGTDNPHSDDPADALSPQVPGSSGWRLWNMLNAQMPGTFVTFSDYESAFQRANLTDLPVMETSGGEVILPADLGKIFRRSTVVLLGDKVRRCFKLPKVLMHPVERDGVTYRQVPHPSGRCRFYNDPAARALVGIMLADLYRGRNK